MDAIRIDKPVSGLRVAFVVLPGLITGAGLLLAGLTGGGPSGLIAPVRLLGVASGGLVVLLALAILFSSSGVLIDPAHRTVTPWFRVFGWSKRGQPVHVAPGDRLVLSAVRVTAAGQRYTTTNGHISVEGSGGQRWLMSTPTYESAVEPAQRIARELGLAFEQR